MLDGLGAALMHDTQSATLIKEFAKQIDLNGNLIINLIDFCQPKPKNLPQTLAFFFSNI